MKYRKYRRSPGKATKLSGYEDTVVAALKADAHTPRNTDARHAPLFAQIQAQGYQGGYTALTNFIRVWREQSGKEPQRAFGAVELRVG